jgi:Ser/Thr protein kinase RdoA (MazF antagonist)
MLDGDRLELLDFDDSHYGWHAYDLAVPLYCFTHAPVIVRSVGSTPGLLDDLLEGYQREWPMAPAWQARIPGFVRFRRMLVLADCHRFRRTESDWYRYHLSQLSRREPLA